MTVNVSNARYAKRINAYVKFNNDNDELLQAGWEFVNKPGLQYYKKDGYTYDVTCKVLRFGTKNIGTYTRGELLKVVL